MHLIKTFALIASTSLAICLSHASLAENDEAKKSQAKSNHAARKAEAKRRFKEAAHETPFNYRYAGFDLRMMQGDRFDREGDCNGGDKAFCKVEDRAGIAANISWPILADKSWGGLSIIGTLGHYSGKAKTQSKKEDVSDGAISAGVLYHLNIGSLSKVEKLKKMDVYVSAEVEYVSYEYITKNLSKVDSESKVGPKLTGGMQFEFYENLSTYFDLNIRTAKETEIYPALGMRWNTPVELLTLEVGLDLSGDKMMNQIGLRFNF